MVLTLMWISSEELMITKLLTVSNKLGIHARPAGMIVDITGQAKSNVSIVFDGSKANAKSIVKFEIDGEDEELVVQQLEKLFDDHFNEEPC